MTLRAAVIGTGFMGWVHVEALRRAGVEPIGVLGSSAAKSQAAATEYQVANAYSSLDELLQDPLVDAVHVATPNRLHYEMTRRSILAGKHVMCEKPLTLNSDESRELVRLASEHPQLATGVNFNIRFYPLCIELRAKREAGDFGRLFSISGGYVQDWLQFETDYNWRVLRSEAGDLRAVADIGTHWMDLATWITGERIDSVFADLHTVHTRRQRPQGEVKTFAGGEENIAVEPIEIDTEDVGNILLRFSSGARGNLHVSQVTAGRKNCLRLEVAAEHGSAFWNSETPNEAWLGSRTETNRQLLRDPALLSENARAYAGYPGGHNEGYADTFKQCFRAFYHYIAADEATRQPDFPTFADGHQEVAVCEAIWKSQQQQTWVSIEGTE